MENEKNLEILIDMNGKKNENLLGKSLFSKCTVCRKIKREALKRYNLMDKTKFIKKEQNKFFRCKKYSPKKKKNFVTVNEIGVEVAADNIFGITKEFTLL